MAQQIKQIIDAVKVEVNGIEFGVVSGSAMYKDGKAERTVVAADNSEVYVAKDASTQKGMIKFEYHATQEQLDAARQIEELQEVTVKLFNEDFSRTMLSGVALNTEDKTLGSDGKATLTFEGSPLE